jgi:hypothetical protein
MVAPAFGFSAGDFISAIAFVSKVAHALRSTDGATTDYQQTCLDLTNLETTLRKVQALRPISSNTDTVDKIHLLSLTCHRPLAHFLQKTRQFETQLSSRPVKSRKRTLVRLSTCKLHWAVIVAKEAKQLMSEIATPLQAIELLLQLETLQELTNTGKATQETVRQGQTIQQSVDELKTLVTAQIATRDQYSALANLIRNVCLRHDETIDNSHPVDKVAFEMYKLFVSVRRSMTVVLIVLLGLLPRIRHWLRALLAVARMPTQLLNGNIVLDDALGRRMSLPYEHFRHWAVLEARIQTAFNGLPGESQIKRREFLLFDNKAGGKSALARQILEKSPNPPRALSKPTDDEDLLVLDMEFHGSMTLASQQWSKIIQPGARLTMSIYVKELEDDHFTDKNCPGCSSTNLQTSAGSNKWQNW